MLKIKAKKKNLKFDRRVENYVPNLANIEFYNFSSKLPETRNKT